MGAPRVRFHQFRRPSRLSRMVRVPQKVLPMANHWTEAAVAKRMGVVVRRVPERAPTRKPGTAVGREG